MIQFVIGAIAGVAAKEYFTKERVEKIKDFTIDKAIKIYNKIDAFSMSKRDIPYPDIIYFDSEVEALKAENEALHTINLCGYVTYAGVALMAGIPEEIARLYSDYGWGKSTDFRTRRSDIKPDKWYITKEEPGKLDERTKD